jgi:hypothetical protein
MNEKNVLDQQSNHEQFEKDKGQNNSTWGERREAVRGAVMRLS